MKAHDKSVELWELFKKTGNIFVYIYYASLKKHPGIK